MGNNDDGQLGLGDTLDHINVELVLGLSETPRYNTEGLDASFAQTTFIRACPQRCVMPAEAVVFGLFKQSPFESVFFCVLCLCFSVLFGVWYGLWCLVWPVVCAMACGVYYRHANAPSSWCDGMKESQVSLRVTASQSSAQIYVSHLSLKHTLSHTRTHKHTHTHKRTHKCTHALSRALLRSILLSRCVVGHTQQAWGSMLASRTVL